VLLSGAGFFVLLFTMSRSGIVGLTAGALSIVLLSRFGFRRNRGFRAGRSLASVIVIIASGAAIYYCYLIGERQPHLRAYTPLGAVMVLSTALDQVSDSVAQNRTVLERITLWRQAADVVWERPLLGTGFRASGLYYSHLGDCGELLSGGVASDRHSRLRWADGAGRGLVAGRHEALPGGAEEGRQAGQLERGQFRWRAGGHLPPPVLAEAIRMWGG